jgi:hypothetical protein
MECGTGTENREFSFSAPTPHSTFAPVGRYQRPGRQMMLTPGVVRIDVQNARRRGALGALHRNERSWVRGELRVGNHAGARIGSGGRCAQQGHRVESVVGQRGTRLVLVGDADDDFTGIAADVRTPIRRGCLAHPFEHVARVAALGAAVVHRIDIGVARRIALGDPDQHLTGVAIAVSSHPVAVLHVGVRDGGTCVVVLAIARIARPVLILVRLVGVGVVRTVVCGVRNGVRVAVGDATAASTVATATAAAA